ncbi:MAG: hypothetical protein JWO11_4463 [Nocardioides sp.]|nr:hypothetical protein [Nocardioides sp.]
MTASDADRAADLSWDEAMRLAAVDREQLLAELRKPQLRKHVRRAGWLRWHWWLTDDNKPDADATVVVHTALTQRSAWRRCHRAYLTELSGL